MNKVMTRTTRHPGSRPPGRQDSRRPATTSPRAPGGGTTPRTPPGGSPPPPGGGASRATPSASHTTSPASRTTPPGSRTTPPAGRPPTTQAGATTRTAPPAAIHRPVPAQTPHRPTSRPRPTDLFADLLLAVLSGQRPVHCMLRHTAGRAYDELAWLAERGLLRTRGTRPVVRDIGYYVPRPGAIEAFARIGAGEQLRAMAFRLEQAPDLRWRCTAVELGGPRMPHTSDD
ncbi:Rv3235 family protein [Streptomyces sp. NPDC087263]|uniref:Rv3235 family protein n=1 Tax=Streptomyces sp. NPDC087263 TaxID=3365773 RepID=UPI00382E014B